MKRRHALPALLLGPTSLLASPSPAAAGERVRWPDVALLDGRRWPADATQGRAVVAVFWSTTCAFCRRHNQHVEKLHRRAAAQGLAVLGIARERDAEAVRRYAAAQGYSFPITTEHAPLAAALSTRTLMPLTVTVNRHGRLQQVIPGEMTEDDVLELQKLAA